MALKRAPVTPRILTAEDKVFVKLVAKGIPRTKAFKTAYPNHPGVKRYMDIKPGEDPDRKYAATRNINQLAKDKARNGYIQKALATYNSRMDVFSEKAVETAIDLVENARSEKVRADLAIEGMRHKVGTPVQKVQVQQQQDIVITFGDRHPNDVIDLDDIVEGDVL